MRFQVDVERRDLVLLLAVLAGCGSGPAWVLHRQESKSSAYIDQNSLRRDGKFINATLRIVYTEAISDLMAEKPHWSSVMKVSIDCDARSWTTRQFETFDMNGVQVEKKEYSAQIFYVYPDWNDPRAAPRLICEHLNNGRALAPASSSG